MPEWLVTLAWLCLAIGLLSSLIILFDLLAGHPQHMWIMDVVWPITALYAGPLALWGYFTAGRLSTKQAVMQAKQKGQQPPGKRKPFWQITALAATHCGGGCTLGDIVGEPLVATLGLSLFGAAIFAAWGVDFVLAYCFGILFQYFTIVPMRGLPLGKGLWTAVKADTLSLVAWQLGMYGWMAIAVFAIFGHEMPKTSPVFWFMMQIAMIAGFCTAYPVNWWLVRRGIKERM